MATLISNATGNLTGASTFVLADAINLGKQYNANQFPAAGSSTSAAFTVGSGKVIDGVILYLQQIDGTANTTGTLKADLQKGGVSQASVTINKTDIPLNPNSATNQMRAAMFLKFTSTATGDGAANWTLVITTTGVNGIYYTTTTFSGNAFCFCLRTTTAATPAAADDLFIIGEMTGAATHNSFTVNMVSTTAVTYGSAIVSTGSTNGGHITVGAYGTFTWGTAAATNYILRVAGDLRVHAFGTLNIGSVGAELPRTSTALLEFVLVTADGDFGLMAFDYSTINIVGLSRTASKNVTKCRLTSDLTVGPAWGFSSTGGLNQTSGTRDYEATGTSLLGLSINENGATGNHFYYYQAAAPVTNVTQVASAWIGAGTGPANNRYVRMYVANTSSIAGITNGFYTDIDLVAGTASGPTAIGTGVATSVSIVASGTGWAVKLTGKLATTSATPVLIFVSCSTPGTVSYTGSTANWTFVLDHVGLVTAASLPDTTFNVTADTGWLAGDVVCVGATSRTPTECELFTLGANAGASSFTSPLAPGYFHSGTAPTQGYIGLVNRNIKVRSSSTTITSFVYLSSFATTTIAWVEFSRFGGGSTLRRGIEIDPSTGGVTASLKSITYCSLHDNDNYGVFVNNNFSNSLNLTVAHNVTWNIGPFIYMSTALTAADWTIDNNLVMRSFSYGLLFGDLGGVTTNNIVTSCTSQYAYYFNETNGVIGTFSDNVAAATQAGLQFASTGTVGVINNFTVWRCATNATAIYFAAVTLDVVFNNLTAFGNTNANVNISANCNFVVNTGVICGDASFPTLYGISTAASSIGITLNNVDMSGVGTGLAPHATNDFFLTTGPTTVTGRVSNCKFGAPVFLAPRSLLGSGSAVGFANYNQTAGDHRCEMAYGQLRTDSVIYNTATPSERMTPTDPTNKLRSAPDTQGVKVPVAIASAIDVSVWVKKSDTAAGAAYLGNQPRVIQRANPALGQNADVVLVTDSSSPSPSATPTTWDTVTALLVTLSNGNLTVTNTGGGAGEQGARSNAAKTSGKHYFEVTNVATMSGGNTGFGICTTASTYTNMGSSATTGTSVFPNGNIWTNGGSTGLNIGSIALGNVIGIAIDLDNRRAWFRLGAAGNWNGLAIGSANPATNIGGVTIPAGTMVPVCHFNSSGNVFTANFGATTFTGAVPSGFASGWLTLATSSSWVQLIGTSSTATADGVWEFFVDCDGAGGWINVDDWAFTGVATTANGLKNWYYGIPLVGGSGGGGGGASGYFSGGFV